MIHIEDKEKVKIQCFGHNVTLESETQECPKYPFELDHKTNMLIGAFNHKYETIELTSTSKTPTSLKPIINGSFTIRDRTIQQNIGTMEYHTNELQRKNQKISWKGTIHEPKFQIVATSSTGLLVILIIGCIIYNRRKRNPLIETVQAQILSNISQNSLNNNNQLHKTESTPSINISIGNTAVPSCPVPEYASLYPGIPQIKPTVRFPDTSKLPSSKPISYFYNRNKA